MNTHRMRRVLVPSLALLVLAVALLIAGSAMTSVANAAPQDRSARVAAAVQTRDAIIEFGDPVRIAENERVQTVVSFGGDVTVAGTVTETVVAFGGDVRILPTARVGGDLSSPGDPSVVAMGGTITIADGARVTGEVKRIDEGDWSALVNVPVPHIDATWTGFSFLGWLVQTAIFLVLGLVAAALMPRQMLAVGRALSARTGILLRVGRADLLHHRAGGGSRAAGQYHRHPAPDPGVRRRAALLLLRDLVCGRVHRAEAHRGEGEGSQPDAGDHPRCRRHHHPVAGPRGRSLGAARHDPVRDGRRDPRDGRVAARSQDDRRPRTRRRPGDGPRIRTRLRTRLRTPRLLSRHGRRRSPGSPRSSGAGRSCRGGHCGDRRRDADRRWGARSETPTVVEAPTPVPESASATPVASRRRFQRRPPRPRAGGGGGGSDAADK